MANLRFVKELFGPRPLARCQWVGAIEDPCCPDSSGQGIFDRKEVCNFQIRSLTPQQAAGNALAFAVQQENALSPHRLVSLSL
jgi:hypothetical protein